MINQYELDAGIGATLLEANLVTNHASIDVAHTIPNIHRNTQILVCCALSPVIVTSAALSSWTV